MEQNNQKEYIQKLWSANSFNVRKATEACLLRNPPRMHVAFEVANTISSDKNIAFPYALDTLLFMSNNNCFNMIITTYSTDEYINYYIDHVFVPRGIFVNNVNTNPEFLTKRLFYDIIIDSASGFSPSEDWFWLFNLLKVSRELLLQNKPETKSVFKASDESKIYKAFEVASPAPTGLTSRLDRFAIKPNMTHINPVTRRTVNPTTPTKIMKPGEY